jgi:hypothetical protein
MITATLFCVAEDASRTSIHAHLVSQSASTAFATELPIADTFS